MSKDIKSQITTRELEILDLLSRGLSSSKIAEILFISR
ncbi:LuxR C-terminal-related transcriptional regulator, partial [Prevotella sp.]